jgi:hypothetical protein
MVGTDKGKLGLAGAVSLVRAIANCIMPRLSQSSCAILPEVVVQSNLRLR